MSAAVLTTTAPDAVAAGPRGAGAKAVLALARFEARRLLTSVPVVLVLLGYVAWIVWRGRSAWDGYPALQDADRATQSMPMFVGLAVLVGVNFAMLRSRRHGTEPHFAVLVLPAWQRTAAHALSVVPAALLTAVCVAGQFTWAALKPGAVGHGSPAEMAVGPLTVLLFGMLGVLLARVLRSPLAGPLTVVLLLFAFVLGTGPSGADGTSWLSPVVAAISVDTLPSELLGRPAAWHALYLTGAALCAAFLAVLLSGGRNLAVRAGLALALALAVTGGVLQARGAAPSPELTAARERASVRPEQTCVERGGSTYCAFDEWVPRVGAWAGVVERVRSLAGGTAGQRGIVVRQRIDARYGLEGDAAIPALTEPGQVTVGTAWGGNRVPEFSSAVAAVLVAGTEAAGSELCDGRMVTVMWLSLAWQDDPMDALRRVRLDDSVEGSAIVLSPTDPLSMTEGQTDVVRRLLENPPTGVGQRVKEHWAELTAPGVTTARAAELLGVTGPDKADSCEE
ncbi:ABC transporter permease [Streptomyces sp. NPDC057381]|uniref:ABC transporter permease n=1 Tax=Streptomyces sp. NPDC057381 TaxID=3346111 RepID=UPI00363AD32D